MGGPGRHHGDLLARHDLAVDHPHVRDHAAVGVVDGVEDHRPCRSVRVALGRRDLPDHLVEQFGHTHTGLARHPQHLLGFTPDDVRDLARVPVWVGGRQVDLVEHRDDGEVVVHRQVQIRQRLRLDALRGIDEQHRPLARLQRTAHLVGEVDVSGCVDQVDDVVLVTDLPRQPNVLRLDGDATLAFDIHPVEVLRAHRTLLHHAGELQHPVGQRRLSVIDVGDDAEVPDPQWVGEGGVGEVGNLYCSFSGCLDWHRSPSSFPHPVDRVAA